MRGTVKWFSNVKGFGFILPEGGGKDIFIHHSSIEMEGFRTLVQGVKVEFELGKDPNGREQAMKVRKLPETPPRKRS